MILVADDSEIVRRIAETALSEAGFRVILSVDGESALASAVRESPDVVVLDLLMPNLTGFDVLREMKKSELLRDTPVLMMSGVYKENVVGFLHRLGAEGFVDKESLAESLAFRVRGVLRDRAAAFGGNPPPVRSQRARCAACAVREARTEPDSSRTRSVLVVDDTEAILQVAEQTLRDGGYRVSLARDGVAALDAVEKDRPDVLVLDLLMPRMTGFEVLRELRKSEDLKDLPVLVMSAVYKDNLIEFLHELGADGYVDKENLTDNLLFRVTSLLQERSTV